jgi:4-hydroxybenzoyl-CoA reductase subunit beta
MTLMPEFELARPRDVGEAIAARHEHAGSRFIAGGTDLLVQLRHGIDRPDVLIDLSAIEELGKITSGPGGARIGAGVSIAALARDATMAANYRAVKEAAEMIAAPGHRAMGTVGGNLCLDTRCIFYNQSEWWRRANGYCLKHRGDVCHVAPQGQRCHAAFAGDLAPALLALGAEVEIAGTKGRRRMPLGDLYVEDGRAHLTLSEHELVVAAHLPPDPPPSAYSKVCVRGAIDYPLAGVAVALGMNEGVVKSLQIALTGTNSRPFVLSGTDAMVGRPIDEAALQAIERLVQKQVQPMRTTNASAHYRRLAAAALARRLTAALGIGSRPDAAVSAVR